MRHAYNVEAVRAAFPGMRIDGGGMTPIQARLVFHQERLLFGRPALRAEHVRRCLSYGLPTLIAPMTRTQCVIALAVLEGVARDHPVIGRDPSTGWQDFQQDEEVKHG